MLGFAPISESPIGASVGEVVLSQVSAQFDGYFTVAGVDQGQPGTTQVSAQFDGFFTVAGNSAGSGTTQVSAQFDGYFTVAGVASQPETHQVSAQFDGYFSILIDELPPNPQQTYAALQRIRELSGIDYRDFTPKRVVEAETFTVDFTDLLGEGETLTAASWSMNVYTGTDPNHGAMLQSEGHIHGAKASAKIGGGVSGVYYAPLCVAQTSAGQTLALPDPGRGLLLVV